MGNFKFKKQYLIIAAVGVVFPLAFQNCSQLGYDDALSKSANYGLNESEVLEQKAIKVLDTNCVSCHNPDIPSQGVDLTSVDSMLYVGVVIPNESGQSPLMQVLVNPTLVEHGVLKQKDIECESFIIYGVCAIRGACCSAWPATPDSTQVSRLIPDRSCN